MSDRPKLGAAFAAPDRSAGLTDLLPSTAVETLGGTPAAPTDAGSAPTADAPPTAPSGNRPTASNRARDGAPAPDTAMGAGTRIVSVQLDASVLTRLREQAARTRLSYGALTLRAIDAHAADLAGHWTRDNDPAAATSLFADAPTPRGRHELTQQAQLRISPAAIATITELVTRWGAPNRTALINEALRRYLNTTEEDS